MLPKINRLRKKKDIERVFKGGKGYREVFLFLKFLKNNMGVSRFAFIVSKKITKKSFLRNKIKRTLREIVRKKIFQIKSGFDTVITAQKGIENKNFQEIKKNAEKLFKKSKLL